MRGVPSPCEHDAKRRCADCSRAIARVKDRELKHRPGYRERRNKQARAWRARNPDKVTSYARKYSYGVSDEDIARMRTLQLWTCAICPADLTKVVECVDHCHATKRVRGLLCGDCNLVLGVYEKRQRPRGLLIPVYEEYLNETKPEDQEGAPPAGARHGAALPQVDVRRAGTANRYDRAGHGATQPRSKPRLLGL